MDKLRSTTQSVHHASRSLIIVGVVGIVALCGCGVGNKTQPQADSSPARLTNVSVVMGYEPNVQFAPFYAAIKLGYYRNVGLNLKLNYATEPNALQLLSNGSVDFVDSGGDEVLTAGASGLHVKYVMTQYSRFPSALFFLKHRGLKCSTALKGKTIGIPGLYGASYYGLLAFLGGVGLSASAVHIESIGYNQVSEVAAHQVDAAMGYAPNEPVELRSEGKAVGECDVWKWADIAGAGVATSDSLISRDPAMVKSFVQATLRGLQFTVAHANRAFTISKQSIPDLTDLTLQRRILNRAIAFWKPAPKLGSRSSGKTALGHMDPKVWKLTARVLHRYKIIGKAVSAGDYYTNRFVG